MLCGDHRFHSTPVNRIPCAVTRVGIEKFPAVRHLLKVRVGYESVSSRPPRARLKASKLLELRVAPRKLDRNCVLATRGRAVEDDTPPAHDFIRVARSRAWSANATAALRLL